VAHPDPIRRDRFTELYDAHYGRILGYARRRVGRDDAFDVAAETFTIAWRRFERVPQGEQALWWLYATARRVLANHRRAEHRRADLATAMRNEPAALSIPPPTGESQDVAAAFGRLRADEQELLLLVAWEGLDAAALATVLRCSRNAARIRLHRARRSFALELAARMKRQTRFGHVRSVIELEDSP